MVISDNYLADVIFLIEATAHLSPYAESLKTNYIIPTLEYFSGPLSEERDCSSENNLNLTQYGIVAFNSMDCKPESATVCYAPTPNTNTFLTWLDKIQFVGGGGNQSSHILEGICTAIKFHDDLQAARVQMPDYSPTTKVAKHIILICNSTPLMDPVIESSDYSGYTMDKLIVVIHEKEINLSIISPRKIPFLNKLFENTGGCANSAQIKNFAKDRRHLVLLNGFHLQEKQMSPSSQPPSTEPEKHYQGIKRALSPSNSNIHIPNQTILVRNAHPLMSNETSFAQQNVRGISPSVTPWVANGNVLSPSQVPRNPAISGSVRQRASTPQLANPNLPISSIPSPSQISNLVQTSPASKMSHVNINNVSLRPNNPNHMNQIRTQQMQSPFSAPQVQSPQPQPSPMNIRAVPSPSNSAPSPISQTPQYISQQINQMNPPPINQNASSMPANLPPNMNPSVVSNQRTKIWTGIIEYHDKFPSPNMNGQQQKTLYHLDCNITYQPSNNEVNFTADRWPDKLLINTVPRLLINRLSPIFKNNSYNINFHFSGDSLGLQKLVRAMSNNSVGCIQLPNPANIRIIIVFYMPDKKIFVGFIPHNQDEFMTSMKELIESHKKEQQVKQQQQMLSHIQMSMGHQPQIQPQGQSQTVLSSNQVPNTQPQLAQMGGSLSMQLSHGQMGQNAPGNNAAQSLSSSNANSMFQLQQIPNNPTLQPNQNLNVSNVGPTGQLPQSNTNAQTGNVLLNQTLNANQNKNSVFIGSSTSIGPSTTNSGLQNTLNSTVDTGINQMQQTSQQPTVQNIGQQNAHDLQSNQGPSGQQFNIMPNTPQINISANANRVFPQSVHEREQNLMAIKQLEQNLKEAQRKEMEYQQQQQHPPSKTGQMIANAPLQQPQQNAVRQHLQQQLQHKQMIHLQHQQQQHSGMNNNHQLRHLLQQQQQLRNINPARMQTSVGASHQQPQQQSQLLMQQNNQMPQQQQQFRFQNSIQNQQQSMPQNAGQPHNRGFYEEY